METVTNVSDPQGSGDDSTQFLGGEFDYSEDVINNEEEVAGGDSNTEGQEDVVDIESFEHLGLAYNLDQDGAIPGLWEFYNEHSDKYDDSEESIPQMINDFTSHQAEMEVTRTIEDLFSGEGNRDFFDYMVNTEGQGTIKEYAEARYINNSSLNYTLDEVSTNEAKAEKIIREGLSKKGMDKEDIDTLITNYKDKDDDNKYLFKQSVKEFKRLEEESANIHKNLEEAKNKEIALERKQKEERFNSLKQEVYSKQDLHGIPLSDTLRQGIIEQGFTVEGNEEVMNYLMDRENYLDIVLLVKAGNIGKLNNLVGNSKRVTGGGLSNYYKKRKTKTIE